MSGLATVYSPMDIQLYYIYFKYSMYQLRDGKNNNS